MTKPYDLKELSDEEEAEIQRQIAADPENPEATDEELRDARPFAEVFPELAASIERDRAVDLEQDGMFNLDPDVAEKFLATGQGWQRRINDVLRRASIEETAGEDR